jgi:hypothetical protein
MNDILRRCSGCRREHRDLQKDIEPMRTLLTLLAASTLVAGAALAQPMPPPPAEHAHAPGMGGARGWGEHKPDPARMAAHLRAALQLRPDQDGALQAFVASMQPPAGDMHGNMRAEHEAMAARSTPDKLDHMIARGREHLAELEKHAAAVKTFYAALNPAQQKAFDALAETHMRGMMGHMGHGMMGHPGAE